MRAVKSAVIIAPIGGHGQHVFRPEARRVAALYDVPDERVVLFDQTLAPGLRFASVCERIRQIVATLAPGEVIDSVVVLCHGWKTGDQIGATNGNLPTLIGAFGGRLSERVVFAYFSCSNGADTSVGPGGDGSFADTTRDLLVARGYVWCRATGHLAPGHATQFPFVRFFDGDGTGAPKRGGVGVCERGDSLFATWRAELRKAVDPDGPGPEPMTSLRWTFPWMEIAEIRTWLADVAGLVAETHRAEAPSVLELQTALAKGGYDPGDLDGVPGRRTTSAVKAFQAAHPPLAVDGVPGPQTWRALRAAGLLAPKAA